MYKWQEFSLGLLERPAASQLLLFTFTYEITTATLLKKETPKKVFSRNLCETFKNTNFEENLRTVASAFSC